MAGKPDELVRIVDVQRAPESIGELVKIRDIFAAGKPKELGAIRNDVLAGVLTELISHRERKGDEERVVRTLAKGYECGTLGVRIARFKLALGNLHAELDARTPPNPHGVQTAGVEQIVATIVGCLDYLTEALRKQAEIRMSEHIATQSGDSHDGISDSEREAIEEAGGTVSCT